ncbi:hypothetical protein L1987_21172 [Smallanthus sonchifolius]|uniref:Uncharacterized protein n=1 Tax=Smallanthus sonchifolius TaxID=185202 RepID=A0ACB9IT96_9ASTR|nr:hypothetical protein L1987_21172 [Smallanthus sonchifolius]
MRVGMQNSVKSTLIPLSRRVARSFFSSQGFVVSLQFLVVFFFDYLIIDFKDTNTKVGANNAFIEEGSYAFQALETERERVCVCVRTHSSCFCGEIRS